MIIYQKNKQSLHVDDFIFKCSIGLNGKAKKKLEGDKKTPRGIFGLDKLFIRKDRLKKISTSLKLVNIKKDMGWCDDVKNKNKYNKLIKISKGIKHEKLYRKDSNYDLIIPIKYNFNKPKQGLGSCIFIHLTKNYKPTAGCIALKKRDFLIMLKIINKNTKIKIY